MPRNSFLGSVKQQYEELPYPPRDPNDESRRLVHTLGDNLVVLNHYCFSGNRDFRSEFRCLVAGGGTGDSTIYLAEQLRDCNAEVVYLDFSESSRAIAEERARQRGLKNIRWITDSLLNAPRLDLGKFDFINCIGVLHHLESTEAGLAALEHVLKDDGAMFLMLYGKYARREVYDMQSLLRTYLPDSIDSAEKISRARDLLTALPATNSFYRNFAKWKGEISSDGYGDAGLYDLLLHSQDRCFDVQELYSLAESVSLNIAGFPIRSHLYDPASFVADPDIRNRLASMDVRQKQYIAEQLGCVNSKHEFYLSRQPDVLATLDEEDNSILLFWSLYGKQEAIAEQMIPGQMFEYDDGTGTLSIPVTDLNRALIERMDGVTRISEMYEEVLQKVPGVNTDFIRQELKKLFHFLNQRGYAYLLTSDSYGKVK